MMDHREAVAAHAAERYLLGEMNWGERDEFEAHFFECPDCGRDVQEGAAFEANLREAPPERVPEPFAALKERLAAALRWPVWAPAAAALSVFLLYEHAVMQPALRAGRRAQPVASFLLLGEQRRAGDETAVRVAGDFFRLEAQAPDGAADGDSIRCEVWPEGEPGKSGPLFSFDAPAGGGLVSLLFPSSPFRPGRYILVLTKIAGGGEPRRYAFRYER